MKHAFGGLGWLGAIVLLAGCGSASLPPHPVHGGPRVTASQTGIASFYTGHRTASGERLNPRAFTAAHRHWPFNSRVRVTNQSNGRWVVVRINDRGPFTRGRVIDLTPAAAQAIGLTPRQGLARVRIERLE